MKSFEEIESFIKEGININEPKITGENDPFWQGLQDTGTELWLDTGDIDAASQLWKRNFSALTTNNTLLNKEIQKGIYDDLILKANDFLKDLDMKERVIEIAYILNARHGLRLLETFGGKVSVELHTDMAHDIDRSIEYAKRFHKISGNFIVKIPLTPEGYIVVRKIRELGIPVNFTLNFSARQNLIAAIFSRPNYVNIFLGRENAYVANNKLGDGRYVGEKATLASQKAVTIYSKNNKVPTRQIAASMREPVQTAYLAGVDVFTMPVAVAKGAKDVFNGEWESKRDVEYDISLNPVCISCEIKVHKFWEIMENEYHFANEIAKNPPKNADEFLKTAYDARLSDLFPKLSEAEITQIAEDGKIPVHATWHEKITKNELAPDSLLNLAGLESFKEDQKALDDRILKLIQ